MRLTTCLRLVVRGVFCLNLVSLASKTVVTAVGTSRIACGAGSMQRHGVRPSVCPVAVAEEQL